MTNFENAKELLKTGDYTCALCKDGITYTSTKRGVSPLVEWLTNGTDCKGFSAADKIVGKAAALLYILSGVKEVYAPVMSLSAAEILSRHGITAESGKLVQTIINRSGTGPCPMEQAVANIDDPAQALKAIQNRMAVLKLGVKENR